MTDDVTRPEFDGAIESIRREIRAMSDTMTRDLQRLTKQVEEFMNARVVEAKALGEIQADVRNLQDWRAGATTSIRTLQVGLVIAVLAALLDFFLKAH